MARRLLGLLALLPLTAAAQFGGHLSYQPSLTGYHDNDLAAAYGENPALDHAFDLRLKAEGRHGSWEAALHYELLATGGDSYATRQAEAAAGLPVADALPGDGRRLLDLTDRIGSGDRGEAVQRIDRLTLGYSAPAWVVRLGRQPVSWGNGLAFQALDFVNPFPPLAIDKEYKGGDDMLYLQYLFDSGDDLQLIALPRREPISGRVATDQATVAVKYHSMAGGDLLLASHYGEPRLGLGLAREVGEAVWRLDLDLSCGGDGEWLATVVTNIDYSWSWFDHNLYGYAEYLYSGVGEADEAGYLAPNRELAARLARGELYTLARNYLALGLDVELTPLLHLQPTGVANLDDGSGLLRLGFNYDWAESLRLQGGVNLPWGGRGSEYGGIPLASTPYFQAPGRSLYLRLGWYF